jgi:predicted RNA-binding Zn ribbon-like protein
MTARQIIKARIGKKLPPTADLPPDLKQAVKLLAIQLIKSRQCQKRRPTND